MLMQSCSMQRCSQAETHIVQYHDCLAAVSCVAGLITAYVADTALHDFVVAKKHNDTAGKPRPQLLQTGMSSGLYLPGRALVDNLQVCQVGVLVDNRSSVFIIVNAVRPHLHHHHPVTMFAGLHELLARYIPAEPA